MAFVNIHYGPYDVAGVVRHRTQRLRGLKEQLEVLGHTVALLPSPHWDRVVVEMAGRHVFRCRITYLEYDADAEVDVVCERAVTAVEDNLARVKHPVRTPPPRLMTRAFFEHVVADAFSHMKVHEHISSCFYASLARVQVLEDVKIAAEKKAKMAAEFRGLEGGFIDSLLQRDFVDDLTREKIENFFTEGEISGRIPEDMDQLCEFTSMAIMKAICETKLELQEIIDVTVRHVVDDIVEKMVTRAGNEQESVSGLVADALKRRDRVSKNVLSKRNLVNVMMESISYNKYWQSKQSEQSRQAAIDAENALKDIVIKESNEQKNSNLKPYDLAESYEMDAIETRDYIRNLITRAVFPKNVDLEKVIGDVIHEAVRTVMLRLGLKPHDVVYTSSAGTQWTSYFPTYSSRSESSVFMAETSLGSFAATRKSRSFESSTVLLPEKSADSVDSAGIRDFMRDLIMEAFSSAPFDLKRELEDIVNTVVDEAMIKISGMLK